MEHKHPTAVFFFPIYLSQRPFCLRRTAVFLFMNTTLLKTYLWPQRRLLLFLAVLLFSNIGLQLFNPQLLRQFIEAATAGTAMNELVQTAVLFIAIAVINQGLTVATTYLSQQVAWRSTNALRQDLAAHCLRRNMPFHNSHTPGELIERIDGDVGTLANFFSQFIILIVGNSFLFIGILLLLFREGWQIGLALTLFSLLAVVVIYSLSDIATPHWKADREANAQFLGFIEERLSAIEDIRANGAVDYMLYRLHQLLQHLYRAALKAYTMLLAVYSSSVGLFAVGTVVSLGVGGYLLQQDLITLGAVYLIFHYTQMLQQPLEEMMVEFEDLQQATASIQRISELLSEDENIRLTEKSRASLRHGSGQASDANASLAIAAPAIQFEDVSFAYNRDLPVLQNISFELPAGKVLGIVGRTGSGKSTLIRLLTRLYEPDSGCIKLAAQNLAQFNLARLRQRVGVVTQDVQLFQASLRDNLTFFAEGVENGRLINILNNVGLGDWFATLPDGLDTTIGTGGQGLSAGQAQLLAFARVLLKEPGLVILDEASSRLDPTTERQLEKAIDQLFVPKQGTDTAPRTAIMIAHRLSTIQRADYILLLENGRLLEFAPRVTLANDPASRFAQLLYQAEKQAITPQGDTVS
ncbi:MAG: ABC transporter ATP-binding protein [Chloroflexota bacterium]